MHPFDPNTHSSLQSWNNISLEDTQDALIITRGLNDEQANRHEAYFACGQDLATPVPEPENERRIFVVAHQ